MNTPTNSHGIAFAIRAPGVTPSKERRHSWRSLCLALIVFTSGAFAQNQDLPFSSGSTGSDGALAIPAIAGARYQHALAYDSVRLRTVLFGGDNSSGNSNDTWEYDGINWIQKLPAISPPVRYAHAMAFDSARGRVVLFGGYTNSGALSSDTWEWDGTNWTQKSPATVPAARYGHAMAYDSAAGRQQVVLFGGYNGSTVVGDTWEWNGTNWTQKSPTASPPARFYHALAYDSARGRVVLFGGNSTVSSRAADTWEFDGTTWTQKTTANAPPGRLYHALAFDSTRGRVVLFGGQSTVATYSSDTWEWDGAIWTQKSPTTSPPGRYYQALAYDSAPTRQRLVLFGGFNGTNLADTWEWNGTDWAFKSGPNFPFDMTARANGIWNFTSVTVPSGVTVTFKKNAANAPVVWLATENVQINGSVDVSGGDATGTDVPELVGKGGPGGFDGGVGGTRFDVSNSYPGQPGQGPGGGLPGTQPSTDRDGKPGTFSATYGNLYLQPLIGGSGGGGASSGATSNGGAGGGGGGAILIASSKDIIVNGSIKSEGGLRSVTNSVGGNGSGGAVRLVADRVIGSGSVDVDTTGRIRIEGFFRALAGSTGNSIAASGAAPVATFAASAQGQLIVSSVAGQNVAQPPTGSLTTPDVVFTQAGQITVTVTGTGIPNGTPVRLRITTSGGVIALPAQGAPAVTLSGGNATFTATVPAGTGTIQSFADYTVN